MTSTATWTATLVVCAFAASSAVWAGPPELPNLWRNSLKPQGARASMITLAQDGATDYVIVVPAEATTQEQKAGEDLALWLKEMTGAEFPVVDDSSAPVATEISIGRTNRLASARPSVNVPDLGNEGYGLAVRGKRLFLLGGRKRGPINAVYALLEEDLGLRWYTKEVHRIPRRPTVKFRPVPRSYVPKLLIRDPFYHDAFNGTWSLRNRTNAPSAGVPEEHGGNVDYAIFVHSYNALVPPATYFEEHPDYYMMNDQGKRIPRQLCQTNETTIKIATESCLRILAEKPNAEIISVSKNDGGGSCVCDECRAIDEAEGTDAGSLLHFVNRVAEGIEKVRPDVVVSTLAYLETVKEPKTLRPRHNVAIRLCTDRCMWSHPFTPAEESEVFSSALEGWSAIHDRIHIWDYCVNFSHYLGPMPNMEIITANIRYLMKHNVEGIMEQGNYQSTGGERELMRCWVLAKLMWDPTLDVWKLMHDFVYGYYGEAAPAIWEYNVLLEQTGKDHAESLASPKGGIRYPMDSEFLSKEFLEKATALFARAKSLAESDEILQRVELAELPLIYVKLCQGPEVTGEEYASLIERFETVATREKITHLREGPPDVAQKIKSWRDALRTHQALQRLDTTAAKLQPLANAWRFASDPTDVGADQNWYATAFDDSKWTEVRSDTGSGWETQGFADYTGAGWYRQAFDVPDDPGGKRLYLFFEAVDEDATVYLNGQQVFDHTCESTGLPPEVIWTTPFVFDATERLKRGQVNRIAVRVYNRLGMGGIYKPVWLVASDEELDAPLVKALVERQ